MNEIKLGWKKNEEEVPPIGRCLEVLVKADGEIYHEYPVYYLEKPHEKGYAFYKSDGELLDLEKDILTEGGEVKAWKKMHDITVAFSDELLKE